MFAVGIGCEHEAVHAELALALLIRRRLTLSALVVSSMLAPPTSVLEGEAGTGVTFPSWFTCGAIRLAALVVPGGLVPLESSVLAVCAAAESDSAVCPELPGCARVSCSMFCSPAGSLCDYTNVRIPGFHASEEHVLMLLG